MNHNFIAQIKDKILIQREILEICKISIPYEYSHKNYNSARMLSLRHWPGININQCDKHSPRWID